MRGHFSDPRPIGWAEEKGPKLAWEDLGGEGGGGWHGQGFINPPSWGLGQSASDKTVTGSSGWCRYHVAKNWSHWTGFSRELPLGDCGGGGVWDPSVGARQAGGRPGSCGPWAAKCILKGSACPLRGPADTGQLLMRCRGRCGKFREGWETTGDRPSDFVLYQSDDHPPDPQDSRLQLPQREGVSLAPIEKERKREKGGGLFLDWSGEGWSPHSHPTDPSLGEHFAAHPSSTGAVRFL